MKTAPHVDLVTGQVGNYTAAQRKAHPQLEPLAKSTTVIRGGGAALESGAETIFVSRGGATLSGDPIVLRGVGA